MICPKEWCLAEEAPVTAAGEGNHNRLQYICVAGKKKKWRVHFFSFGLMYIYSWDHEKPSFHALPRRSVMTCSSKYRTSCKLAIIGACCSDAALRKLAAMEYDFSLVFGLALLSSRSTTCLVLVTPFYQADETDFLWVFQWW